MAYNLETEIILQTLAEIFEPAPLSQSNKEQVSLMAKDDLLGKNRMEDVRWLCSLSEAEIVSAKLFHPSSHKMQPTFACS